MAWWSFGKKSKKGRYKEVKASEQPTYAPNSRFAPAERDIEPLQSLRGSATVPESQRQSIDKPPIEEPEELHPAQRTESHEDITALPGAPQHREFESGPHLRNIDELRRSASKAGRVKSDSASFTRKKSSKKRVNDIARENELRSVTQPIAIPKQEPGSIFRRASSRRLSHPGTNPEDSTISLSHAPSLRSAMSGIHEYHRFDLGSMGIFSARPKIRHSLQQPINTPSRTPSRRTTRPDTQDGDNFSMINDLADDYDAPTIRELMERDKRRSEKKRQYHEEKARRRLERQARREREAAGITDDPGEESSRGALQGLGLNNVGAEPATPPTGQLRSLHKGKEVIGKENQVHDPFSDPDPEAVQPVEEWQQPDVATTQATTSPPSSPIPGPKARLSQVTDPNRSLADLAETPSAEPSRRASAISTKRGGTLASLFRRSKRGSQDFGKPVGEEAHGSFSNTSRESMSRQQLPPHLREQPSLTGALSGNVPQRTKSKFREDLPESPSAAPGEHPSEALPVDAAARAREAQVAVGGASAAGPLSGSLASVGSEGSWLSGSKPPRKRESRGNVATPDAVDERPETSESDEVWADAENYPRSNAVREDVIPTLPENSDEGLTTPEEQVRSGEVAKRAVVVQRDNSTRSREGLLTTAARQDLRSSSVYSVENSGDSGDITPDNQVPSPYFIETPQVEEITQACLNFTIAFPPPHLAFLLSPPVIAVNNLRLTIHDSNHHHHNTASFVILRHPPLLQQLPLDIATPYKSPPFRPPPFLPMFTSTSLRRTLQGTARPITASATKANPTLLKTPSSPRFFQSSAAKMVVHNIANKAEYDAIKNDKDIIVIDFMATWCGPCKIVSPVVAKYVRNPPPFPFPPCVCEREREKRTTPTQSKSSHEADTRLTFFCDRLSDEFNQVHFIKVDVDEVPDLAQEYGIRAMPTFKIIKKGEIFDEVVGANPPAIRAAIEKAVA
ncbi:hypothetical protein FH972_022431 [Carpinus fangiana]|uniref:Thioredoxin domain-containing protein n=1 Tax=Carpinus fangiana TaxID=176857 RepID=A0A5N6KUH7_9ROSI|nr:hypothetical protein FH972_022431 [Carpinus fangiana]